VSVVPGRLRPSRRAGIPLADAGALGAAFRRTSLVRVLLALALLALAAAMFLLARGLQAPPSSYFASGAGGIVVTDLSSSIDPAKYRRMARVFRSIAETNQPTGFVVFSDTAYEQLPPGTRGAELRPIVRFFEPRRSQRRGRFGGGFDYPPNPWSGSFRGGTRVSTGLAVARRMVERDGIRNATVMLVSDLDNSPFDNPKLAREIDLYERAKITLRVVPLFPSDEDRALFLRLVGPQAFVANRELLQNAALRERRTLAGSFPAGLFAAGVALLLLLALNERLTGRLTWRQAAA
jgi:hypothetical protein